MAVVRELTRGRMLGTLVAAGAVAAFTIGVAPAVGASVTKPGPPTGVKVTPGNGYAVIAWNAPTSNGESPITGYTAQAMPGGKICSTTGAKTCKILGLTNGEFYYSFTVTARNARGQSTASVPVPVLVGVPLAPTRVTGGPGNGEITVSWAAPATNGSAITKYLVNAIPGSKTCVTTGRSRSCTLTGLSNGTAYWFTVTATNRRGPGAASALSGPVSPSPPGLTGVESMVSDGGGYCAVLDSGGVDCWGDGTDGELGDGAIGYSATPVAVEAVGGVGTLTDVQSLASNEDRGYCAVLDSGGVDCWGAATGDGDLGNGTYGDSLTPVEVSGVGGTGTLTGVQSMVSDEQGFCALLDSGGVDCWGNDSAGQLGNGASGGDATPVEVLGVGGTGTLTGVQSMVSFDADYCAVLNSGGIDCWGLGGGGVLGNGGTADSATPVQVVGIGGSGTLTGVQSAVGNGGSFCAVLDSGGVDCWGSNWGNGDSATPVAVEGVGGVGTLADVQSVASGQQGYCALIDSGGVDCWGYGMDGELGNGKLYDVSPYVSPSPVVVIGVGGVGVLNGVQDVIGNGAENLDSECALLDSGGLDCWGNGLSGVLGNGVLAVSPRPVAVVGVDNFGTLGGVKNVASDGTGYCVLLDSGGVDCWGSGDVGQLGNGTFYGAPGTPGGLASGSAIPVAVEAQ